MPREAEWTLAAGGQEGRIYAWGDLFDPARSSYLGTNGGRSPLPVTSVADGATPEGVYQLSGNAYEWVDGQACPIDQLPADGSSGCLAADPALAGQGILRGGSFVSDGGGVRTTYRRYAELETRSFDLGFRCATDWVEDPEATAENASVALLDAHGDGLMPPSLWLNSKPDWDFGPIAREEVTSLVDDGLRRDLYNAAGNVVGEEVDETGDLIVDSRRRWTYDALGQRTRHEEDSDADSTADRVTTWTHNEQGDLVGRAAQGPGFGGNATTTYAYDGASNLMTIETDYDEDGAPDFRRTYDPPCPLPRNQDECPGAPNSYEWLE